MSGFRIRPIVKAIAGSKTDATVKADLGAAYADFGSIIDINNIADATLLLEEIAGSEACTVKYFLSPDQSEPTVSSGLYQLVDKTGAEIENIVSASTKASVPLQATGYWLAMQGKSGASGLGDIRAFLTGNVSFGYRGSRVKVIKISVANVATALGTSPAQVGSIVNIRGLGNLTLFVHNSDATVNATITPYIYFGTDKPSDLTGMFAQRKADGSKETYVTLANEKAAHFLGNISGDYIGFEGSGNGADVTLYLVGTAQGIQGRR